ncbi:hypothetical protein QJS10_CPB13g01410 [Acorus calamus]|uniref:Plastid lipid-associated protein/fibrillin conserved domain-containing protein n=1 Tax=Acorus calamus TaxID=4465 RepID=A0AAV9DHS8_ACOCL|nr:hypothetical protein QJS10_CPB13g01410 [Acorus calamus]
MANLLLQPSIPPRLLSPVTGTGDIPTTQLRRSIVTPIRDHPIRLKANSGIKVSDQTRSLVGGGEVLKSVGETKEALYEALQGIDRGIFGVPSSKKLEIEGLVRLLESENPTPEPTEDLQKRVDIKYDNSTIAPDQLMNIFQKNYDVLLAIFNPEGWLEITYVDESIRVGRDDKGNIFILERTQEENI